MQYQTPPKAIANLEKIWARVRSLWEPPPDITVSEWAERNRVMPKGTTSRPGPWRTESFQREIQDTFNDPNVREIVVMKSTQIGWSEILNNVAGYLIDNDPKPFMIVQPTADDAKKYGRTRIAPMIAACAVLRQKVREAKSRRGGNTLQLKEFPGGFLKLVGANAGSGLRSDPLPAVLADEIDGYPDDVNGEGDPLEIAKRRTDGYADYKFLMGSTPAKPKGLSRIEREYERSDKRRYLVPCPHCGHRQVLKWRDAKSGDYRLVFERNDKGDVIRDSVRYVCESCRRGIPERFKQQMLDGGRWVAEAPGRPIIGFHINALYSPWKENWGDLAQEWIESQDNPEKLRAFINLRLGETWEEAGETVATGDLEAPGRREKYQTENPRVDVPHGVGVLTMAVDVQDGRLEAKVKGWGVGEESWLIAHEVFFGDPGAGGAEVADSVWHQLDELRLKEFAHASGRKMRVAVTVIDSGGHHTDSVYDYVQPRQNIRDRVFAIKGVEFHTKPALVQEGSTRRNTIRLYTVATHPAKDRVFSRLKITQHGPGFVHLPEWAQSEYLAQLTGEKKIGVRDKRTRTKRYIWVKTHTRNEGLDLEVYSLAALFIVQNFLHRFRDLKAAVDEASKPPAPEGGGGGTPPKAGGGGWMGGVGSPRGGGWMG